MPSCPTDWRLTAANPHTSHPGQTSTAITVVDQGVTSMNRRAVLATAAVLALSGAAAAQEDYPDRPITMVVPFSAGGPTDTVARLIAEPMSRELGQQIVVQNVTGAGGTLAATQVANAPPDGYTVLMHHIGMSTAPTLHRNL